MFLCDPLPTEKVLPAPMARIMSTVLSLLAAEPLLSYESLLKVMWDTGEEFESTIMEELRESKVKNILIHSFIALAGMGARKGEALAPLEFKNNDVMHDSFIALAGMGARKGGALAPLE